MSEETKEEGRVANVKGISRNKNPYKARDGYGLSLDWDMGWLMQTQHWAGRPESMCKGERCTAVRGEPNSKHSLECHKEHRLAVDRHFQIF